VNNPAPVTLDRAGVISQLKQWITNGTVTPAPTVNENNLEYFRFPPTTTQLTLNGLKGDTDFCGYHSWDKVNPQSADSDLFFGIVSAVSAQPNNPTDQGFVSALSACISHELAEPFTDRDGEGYKSVSCQNPDSTSQKSEIRDICENKGTFQFQRTGSTSRWSVEQFWSNWDNTCIRGDRPVSLRAFLRSIGFNFASGLQSLNTPVINLQFIASRQ
jgi:hypothetical protein